MGKFFEELASKLATRWVSLLLVPGALWLVAAWIATRLGQGRAVDYAELGRQAAAVATSFTRQPAATQIVIGAAVVLAVAGLGLAVQALAPLTRFCWLGRWPTALGRWRVRARRRRWDKHVRARVELESAHPRAGRDSDMQARINTYAERANRIALAKPGRPTWMGDRVHAVEQVALDRYGFDTTFGWSRLWLVLPEQTRAEINAAHSSFAGSVAVATWAWPYLLLGAFWWPAAVIAVAVGVTGWARARPALADFTSLSEAAIDLHGRALAVALGVAGPDSTGPLSVVEGERITGLLRKGR